MTNYFDFRAHCHNMQFEKQWSVIGEYAAENIQKNLGNKNKRLKKLELLGLLDINHRDIRDIL